MQQRNKQFRHYVMLRATEFLPGFRKLQRGSVIRRRSRAEFPLPPAETLRNSASTADTLFSFVLPPPHSFFFFFFFSCCCYYCMIIAVLFYFFFL
jgi:hypothetical protein